jgi:mRNA-degrading endonuclease toxin of MazEF toxin-antitoxin module
MPVSRGDVVLAFVENVGTSGGKLRPALVAQSDRNNARLNETIIAAITSNTSRIDEAHQLLIDISTEDGAARLVRLHALGDVSDDEVRRLLVVRRPSSTASLLFSQRRKGAD